MLGTITKISHGFSTNSSSSHSIVLVPDQHSKNINPNRYFGWENFLAKDFKDKLTYFCLCLKHSNPKYKSYRDDLDIALKPIFKCYPEAEELPVEWLDAAVDHQSVIYCPTYHDDTLATDFYRKISWPIITDQDIGISGGGDNVPREEIYLPGQPIEIPIIDQLRDNPYWVIREEKFGYILFNTNNGKKIRWKESNWGGK